MQNAADLARIERNVQKMRSMGASDAEITQYLDEEDGNSAPTGSAPTPPETPQPRKDQVVVTEAQGGFLTDSGPPPDAGPPKRSIFTPEEEANIKAFVEEQGQNLTPEAYRQFLQDLSGGELDDPTADVTVANFKKFGWGGTTYPDAVTKDGAPVVEPEAPKPERFNAAATFGLNALDGAALNTGTELVSGIQALGDDPLNFWNAFQGKYARNSAAMEQRAEEDPLSAITGNIVGSALTPSLRVAKGIPTPKRSIIEGGVYGGSSGIGAGEGSLYDRLDEGTTGAAIGATAGAVLGGGKAAVGKEARDNRWINKQLQNNPYAAYDAEIAQDLERVMKGTAKSATDPKGRAPVTAKEINNLEQAYVGRFKEKIDKLDIPPSEKLYIKEALDGKHSLDQLNVELLRGTEYGNAVADGITRVQRLRALTPEIASKNVGTTIKRMLEGASAIGGAVGGNAVIPGYGAGLGAVTYGAARYALQRMGNTEAARVNAAEDLIKKVGRYRKLADRVGPSGADESKQAFDNTVNSVVDKKYYEKKAQEAEAKQKALDQLFKKDMRESIYTGEPDPLDAIFRSPASKRELGKDIQDLTKANTAFAKLNKDVLKPAKAPKIKEPSAKDKAIMAQIEQGIKGTSKTQEAFATRVGVPVPDMLRALDKVAQEVPEFADDIKRIQFNYPTSQRGLADILVPRMQKYLNEDGTMDAVKAKAAEASAKVEARKKIANPDAVTSAPARASEGDLMGISRPEQWQAGKDQFQAQADERINNLFSDDSVSDKSLKIISTTPDTIKNNFRTFQEAKEYIDEVVMPDLDIEGIDPSEQANIRAHLLDIASAKRYKTKADYEQGTKKKQ